MTRYILKPQTNIRRIPSDASADTILATTSATKYVAAQSTDNGAEWLKVDLHGVYVRRDRVVQLSDKVDPEDVPYASQRRIGRLNACGPACIRMAVEAMTKQTPPVADISRLVDPTQDGTTSDDLVRAAAAYGVPMKSYAERDSLPDRLPAIVLHYYRWSPKLTEYRNADGSSFTGLHWAMLLAYDNDYVVMNDPLWLGTGGAAKRYPMSEWLGKCYLPVNGFRWYVSYADENETASRAIVQRVVSPKSTRMSAD